MKKETLVIGDIHGSYDELLKLLELVKYEVNKYKIIFLGDYTDRGPKSKEVIDLLIQIKEVNEETVFLLGNHDDWFVSFLNGTIDGDGLAGFLEYGGYDTLKSYVPDFSKQNMDIYDVKNYIIENYPHHIDFLNSLELYHEDNHYYYAHGGCKLFESDISKNTKNDFIWPPRVPFYNTKTELDKTIIVGHTVVTVIHKKYEPYIARRGDKIAIDGGIVFGGIFIAMLINNETGEYRFEILGEEEK